MICYTYYMSYRTTIILDEESRDAARQLALRLDCSTSEAIRIAIVRHKETVFGLPSDARRQRTEALRQLISLSEDMDPETEVARLKQEDEGF